MTKKVAVSTKKAPQAIGPYSQGIILNSELVFFSGQIPLNPETSKIASEDVSEQTHQVMKNMAQVLEAAGSSFDKVIKTTIFITTMKHFSEVNAAYEQYFSVPYPARSTIAVKELPCDALVEIEAIAYKDEGSF